MRVQYNSTFYESQSLKAAAKLYESYLPAEVDTLVSMGYSGCSIATAIMMVSRRNLKHICLRKNEDKEVAHSWHAGPCLSDYNVKAIAIVDDFICEGKTMQAIWDSLKGMELEEKVKVILISYMQETIHAPWLGLVYELEQKKPKVKRRKTSPKTTNCGTSLEVSVKSPIVSDLEIMARDLQETESTMMTEYLKQSL